jgi:hypothetical protein
LVWGHAFSAPLLAAFVLSEYRGHGDDSAEDRVLPIRR